jgi:hypothetical protein
MNGVEEIESGFEVFQQLKKLTIGNVLHINQTIQALERAPALSCLSLPYPNQPIGSLSQVKNLTIWRSNSLTEFPAAFVHLRSLTVSDCYNLQSFPAFLPSLQRLHIGGANKIAFFKIFGEPNTPPLNEVTISYCTRLTEIQITRRITSLEIHGCDNLKEIHGNELVRSLNWWSK